MGHWPDEDGAFDRFLKNLIDTEVLEGPAHGIAIIVLKHGVDALSPKQMDVFNQYVIEAHANKQCRRCEGTLEHDEHEFLEERNGLCCWCAHQAAKDD